MTIDHVSGQTLKDIRQAAGMSLQRVASAMAPPVSRQHLFRIEGRQSVPPVWVGRYQAAITQRRLMDEQDRHARLAVGTHWRTGGVLYSGLLVVKGYDDGYRAGSDWQKANPRVVRVTLVVTAWPETQGVIDALTHRDVQVILIDPLTDTPVRRRV
jgi:hypothetical protein